VAVVCGIHGSELWVMCETCLSFPSTLYSDGLCGWGAGGSEEEILDGGGRGWWVLSLLRSRLTHG
jgi:hypothetical protein